MTIGVLTERRHGEKRVGLVPSVVKQLCAHGHTVLVEAGAGISAGHADVVYREAGAHVLTAAEVASQSELIVAVFPPSEEQRKHIRAGTTLICMVFPKRNPDTLRILASLNINTFALDALPRITRAQSMDVLSSQNNLAGYKAVIVGAQALNRIFPLMSTAAGTVKPATVVIYGAGVAGLQALATARRMGAVVYVTDLRPETQEQVESLGGRFITVAELENVQIEGGYVVSASSDVLLRQKEAVEKVLFSADLVITTALVAGGSAPCLITREQVRNMKPGAVIVDLAADAGGNCECTNGASEVTEGAVTILGCPQLAASVPNTASELYAKNVQAFINEIAKDGKLSYDLSNEIVTATLIVYNGELRA